MEFCWLLIFVAAIGHSSIQLQAERTYLRSGIVQPGYGYSSDSEQIAGHNCYQVTGIVEAGIEQSLTFNKIMKTKDVASALGVSIEASGGFGLFSLEEQAKYVRDITENDYSLSLNYVSYTSRKVLVKYGGYGEKALNNYGKEFYQNGTNPNFGIVCGDQYLESYQLGAILAMNLKIEFNNAQDKREFGLTAKGSYGNIFKALADISTSAKQNNYTASITVRAYQVGAEESLLQKAIDAEGITCGIDSTEDCLKIAKGLLAYASGSFASQINGRSLVPLNLDSTSYKPISDFGLKWKSLVNDEVLRARKQLVSKMHENNYYKQKLHPFFHSGYYVPLDQSFEKKAKLLHDKVEKNIAILMAKSGGAATCWSSPNTCLREKSKMDSEMIPITRKDLDFLNKIKYIYIEKSGITLCNDGNSWLNSNEEVIKFYELVINSKELKYKYFPKIFSTLFPVYKDYSYENLNEKFAVTYDCHSNDGGNSYKCSCNYPKLQLYSTKELKDYVTGATKIHGVKLSVFATEITKTISPFYFEIFK